MTWIDTVPYEAANGRLRKIYDQITGPDKNIDNIMLVHSLRPIPTCGEIGSSQIGGRSFHGAEWPR